MPLRHPRQSTGLLHEMRSQTEALRGVAAFSHRVSTADEIGAAVARAFTLFATGRPRPVHIEIPLDLLETAEKAGEVRGAPAAGTLIPPATGLREAAEALRTANRPALVLGGGARGAAGELLALAEEFSAPVVTTANGKGIVDESHPLSLGVSLHSPAVQKWLTERDVVLAVGTELAESDLWSEPPPLGGTLVRVDVDPAQMYAALPADVALVGDAQQVLGALLAACRDAGARPGAGGIVTALRPPRAVDLCLVRDAGSGADDAGDGTPGAAEEVAALRLARDARPGSGTRAGCRTSGRSAASSTPTPSSPPTAPSAATTGPCRICPSAPAPAICTPPDSAPSATPCPPRSAPRPRTRTARSSRSAGTAGCSSPCELATAAQLRLPLPVVVFDNGGYGEIRDEMAAGRRTGRRRPRARRSARPRPRLRRARGTRPHPRRARHRPRPGPGHPGPHPDHRSRGDPR